MKLNPPASSSDLAAARTIARRLHQRAYGAAVTDTTAEAPLAPSPREAEAPRRPAPPPLPPRPVPPPVVAPAAAREPEPPPVREPEPRPEPPSRREPEAPPGSKPRPEPPPRPEPEPPPRREPEPPPVREPAPQPEQPWSEPPPRRGAWDEDDEVAAAPPTIGREEPELEEPEFEVPPPPPVREETWEPPAVVEDDEEDIEIEAPGIGMDSDVDEPVLEGADDDAFAELTGGGGPSAIENLADDDEGPAFRPAPEPELGEEPELDQPELEPTFDAPALEAPPYEQPEIDVDEELVPAGPESYAEPVPRGAEVSPEDLIGGPEEAAEPWAEEESPLDAEIEAAVGSPIPDDLVEAPPSWDDVTDVCLEHAAARGAMLVEASGQVLSARGDWPNPGPEAIANRLVAMMDRALRDAPTRSVSAPLAGQHLTAWRVPLGDTMLTAVFVGDAPVRADARPAIDDEIRRAAGV